MKGYKLKSHTPAWHNTPKVTKITKDRRVLEVAVKPSTSKLPSR